jgi:ribosomal protein S18 acetylase RimI-like enzyme
MADEKSDKIVGMARVIGDSGCVYQICDIVVRPAHQGQGLGSQMMDTVMKYINKNAPETAYVNLIADIEGFYERWGFEPTAPESQGMYLRV